MKSIVIALIAMMAAMLVVNANANKVTECEVCESVITRLRAQLPDDATPEEIELQFKEFCKTAKGKDEKFVSADFDYIYRRVSTIHLQNSILF